MLCGKRWNGAVLALGCALGWPLPLALAQDEQEQPSEPLDPVAPADSPPVDEPSEPPLLPAEPEPQSPLEPAAPAAQAPPSEPQPPPEVPLPNYQNSRPFLHDGFYLRLGLGPGFLHMDGKVDPGNGEYSVQGGGMSLDVMVGGTPTPGLVVGGASWFTQTRDPDFDVAGVRSSSEIEANLALLGAFIDGYPDPSGGFHVGGVLGFAVATVRTDDTAVVGGDHGFGLGAFLGYDAWIAEQWTLGGVLRFSAAGMRNSEDDLDETLGAANLALLFTAVYH